MSQVQIAAWNHKEWAARGLKDYGDYADCVTYYDQIEYGDDQLEGRWFYADDQTLTVYAGTFGNDNSPGADSYTWANVYSHMAEYNRAVEKLEAMEEYGPQEATC